MAELNEELLCEGCEWRELLIMLCVMLEKSELELEATIRKYGAPDSKVKELLEGRRLQQESITKTFNEVVRAALKHRRGSNSRRLTSRSRDSC